MPDDVTDYKLRHYCDVIERIEKMKPFDLVLAKLLADLSQDHWSLIGPALWLLHLYFPKIFMWIMIKKDGIEQAV